ncbi:S-adenosyl-L-methionine-dependent methyltransferase [Cytidiella melzeri]|nr:S-adenosyl-L-methionine-dependent methyltransferase [Cytidiella melzeri]
MPKGTSDNYDFMKSCLSSYSTSYPTSHLTASCRSRIMAQSQASSHYATSHGHSKTVLEMHSWRTAENSAPYLLPYLEPHMQILDVGCGPGSITIDFASRVPQGHATGVDYALGPVEAARTLALLSNVPNVSFQTGDIYSLPFPAGTFDVTHTHQVLQHVAEPVKALREMRRVTKPGGIVACRETDIQTYIFYPEAKGLSLWVSLIGQIGRMNGCEPQAGRSLGAWARQAGFDTAGVTCGAGSWCFSTPAQRAYWGGSIVSRFEDSNLSATAVSAGLATKEEIEDSMQAMKEWITHEDGYFALLHGEMIARV